MTAPVSAPGSTPRPAISDRMIGLILLIGGLVGALAAFVLAVEKIALLKNPAYVPSCSINPILSCGSIMSTGQAEAFGFANPLIGVAAFPVVAATGAAVLARVTLPRWWWLSLQAGAVFGVGFVHWLAFQSLYRIGALCPYCMVAWVVMIVIFCYLTLYTFPRATAGAARFHSAIPLVWLLLLATLIGIEFWTYWRTLL